MPAGAVVDSRCSGRSLVVGPLGWAFVTTPARAAKPVDWVNSATSLDEMGSIHTIQGYDLNVAGVVIGRDLRYDRDARRIRFDRTQYRDRNGKANNNQLGLTYTDDQLLEYVRNIYTVLLTRGIRGTYVYVCDPDLREYLRPFFPVGRR